MIDAADMLGPFEREAAEASLSRALICSPNIAVPLYVWTKETVYR